MAYKRGESLGGENDKTIDEDILDNPQPEGIQADNQEEMMQNDDSDENTPAEETEQEGELTLEAELEKAKEEAESYYTSLQRLQAEFDNFRKRTQKEKEDIVKYSAERVVEALLPILDNFERAIDSAKSNKDFDGFAKGVDMIFRQMHDVLGKEGLKAIESVGQSFDPNLHEAVLQVDSEEHPENTVVEELQKGYYLKDKVLRPSMVKVSR